MSVLVFSVTIMASSGPNSGNSRNAPYPASYVGLIGTGTVANVLPYTGGQPGVNSVIRCRYPGGRTLNYKNTFYVNQTVAQIVTAIG